MMGLGVEPQFDTGSSWEDALRPKTWASEGVSSAARGGRAFQAKTLRWEGPPGCGTERQR